MTVISEADATLPRARVPSGTKTVAAIRTSGRVCRALILLISTDPPSRAGDSDIRAKARLGQFSHSAPR